MHFRCKTLNLTLLLESTKHDPLFFQYFQRRDDAIIGYTRIGIRFSLYFACKYKRQRNTESENVSSDVMLQRMTTHYSYQIDMWSFLHVHANRLSLFDVFCCFSFVGFERMNFLKSIIFTSHVFPLLFFISRVDVCFVLYYVPYLSHSHSLSFARCVSISLPFI